MKRMMIWIFLALFLSSPAQASEEHPYDKATRHHQKIVDACREKSQPKWDTGNTMTMQEGAYDYIQCLTDEIERISDVYFVSYNDRTNNDEKDDRAAFLKDLKLYTEQSLKLYSHIHSGPCAPCGTHHHVMYIMEAATDLEKLMKEMLIWSYEYQRPVEEPDKH